MKFVILPSEGTMSIDNAQLELETRQWIASNIEIVAWRGNAENGLIEYNDRPRVMQKTTRLEDYIEPINAWINAASQLPNPITVPQARRIKSDAVDALYNSKRIAPFSYAGYTFDGADEAVSHMASLVATVGGFANINTWSQISANNWNSLAMDLSQVHQRYSTSGAYYYIGINPPDQAWADHTHPVTLYRHAHQLVKGPSPAAVSGFNPRSPFGADDKAYVTWQPLNPSAQVTFDTITFRNVLRAIISRRISLNYERAAKKRTIEALTTIAQVVAFNITGGWPA